jgi:hypothetical protein
VGELADPSRLLAIAAGLFTRANNEEVADHLMSLMMATAPGSVVEHYRASSFRKLAARLGEQRAVELLIDEFGFERVAKAAKRPAGAPQRIYKYFVLVGLVDLIIEETGESISGACQAIAKKGGLHGKGFTSNYHLETAEKLRLAYNLTRKYFKNNLDGIALSLKFIRMDYMKKGGSFDAWLGWRLKRWHEKVKG